MFATEDEGPPPRLNRTSVGLKQRSALWVRNLKPSLNRTSVGLKPGREVGAQTAQGRLNRTSVGLKLRFWACIWFLGLCLNRTSVGLKLWFSTPTPPTGGTPQSNQRGIETGESAPMTVAGRRGLNRTSVGLKQGLAGLGYKVRNLASIEPAWD